MLKYKDVRRESGTTLNHALCTPFHDSSLLTFDTHCKNTVRNDSKLWSRSSPQRRKTRQSYNDKSKMTLKYIYLNSQPLLFSTLIHLSKIFSQTRNTVQAAVHRSPGKDFKLGLVRPDFKPRLVSKHFKVGLVRNVYRLKPTQSSH